MIRAERVLAELRKNCVTHVVGLPDNSSARLFDLLAGADDIRLVSVTREGEAFAIAAGLWIGGKTPVVLIQNTGFFESGDSVRGTITRMRIPLVCLITFRGYRSLSDPFMTPDAGALDPDTLSCARLDSAAFVTEPTLRAWGLPYNFVGDDADMSRLSEAFQQASKQERPFATLVTGHML